MKGTKCDESFIISRIVKGTNPDELLVNLDGVVGRLKIGPANSVRDKRLTFLGRLSLKEEIALLVGIVAVVFSATWKLHGLRKELI